MDIKDIIKPENLVYSKPRLMNDNPMHYCPGCSHGVVHKLVAEVIDEMGMEENHRCGSRQLRRVRIQLHRYRRQEAAHGRAPAIATAIKRLNPDKMVFTYQGDGRLGSYRYGRDYSRLQPGENIVIIFINNGIYGMTGGQMAPTTLEGMVTSTCPYGRNVDLYGYPLKISDLVAKLDGACYVTRQSVQTAAAVKKAKKAIRQAFENSMAKKGASLVEIVSTCASGWKMSPEKANKWMEENMFAKYPLGDLKNE